MQKNERILVKYISKVFFLLIFFVVFYALPLKITRVILSTDVNPDYYQFWPVVARAWREIIGIKPTLVFINGPNVEINKQLGDVIQFEPIEGISTSFQAQTIRLLIPALYPDDVC